MITHVTWEIEVCRRATICGRASTTTEAAAKARATATDTHSFSHERLRKVRLVLILGVPSELGAHGGEDLGGEVALAAGFEASVKGGGDDGGGDAGVDRRVHGPESFARIRDATGKVVEVGGAGEGVGGQVQDRKSTRLNSSHL